MRVALIPARGGSVRAPRKNVRDFCGQPMLLYPLSVARESGLFDLIVVSTDDAEIATVAFVNGAMVLPRPADDGTTGTQEIAGLVLDQLRAKGTACVIYPCSPLLDVATLRAGWSCLMQPHMAPYIYSVGPDGQDAGCFYFGWTQAFRNRIPLERGKPFAIPPERVCDINTEADVARAETMFHALRRAN